MGQLYLFQFLLILIALYGIVKKPKGWPIIFIWLLVSPVAAALTFQSPHALRAHNMVIPLTLISAYGMFVFISWLNRRHLKILRFSGSFLLIIVFSWNVARYVHQYYVHMAKTYPFSSQYGVKELVEYVRSREGNFEKIVITDRYDQPYILFLFYLKYPPKEFQDSHELTGRDSYGFSTVRNFSKYEFVSVSWDKIRDMRGMLVAGTDEEIPNEEANIVHIVPFPNGDAAFEVVELK